MTGYNTLKALLSVKAGRNGTEGKYSLYITELNAEFYMVV